ncbi:unnamed protein product [Clonostachys rosea]|uniref:Uncharacterized protein n=1 Tax=Bionectria ochroleuca TaxID=29856 RepID=A0ABY6UG82_BIOOC|nr:unnamed protein product [Clonostachys rosea]
MSLLQLYVQQIWSLTAKGDSKHDAYQFRYWQNARKTIAKVFFQHYLVKNRTDISGERMAKKECGLGFISREALRQYYSSDH